MWSSYSSVRISRNQLWLVGPPILLVKFCTSQKWFVIKMYSMHPASEKHLQFNCHVAVVTWIYFLIFFYSRLTVILHSFLQEMCPMILILCMMSCFIFSIQIRLSYATSRILGQSSINSIYLVSLLDQVWSISLVLKLQHQLSYVKFVWGKPPL